MALLILLVSLVQLLEIVHGTILMIKNEKVELSYKVSHSSICQKDTNILNIYQNIPISDCVTECGLRSSCKILNYYSGVQLCKLYVGINVEEQKQTCAIVRQEDIDIILSPCGQVCEPGKVCDVNRRECVYRECMGLPSVRNGYTLGNRNNVGSRLAAKCWKNSTSVNGIKHSLCVENGEWNPASLHCAIDCGNLPMPINATIVESNGTLEWSRIRYTFKPGCFHYAGSLTRVCKANGLWNGTAPVCGPGICTSPGICYREYEKKDWPGSDMASYAKPTFEQCAVTCQNFHSGHKAIVWGIIPNQNTNCFCKSTTMTDEHSLNDHTYVNFYDMLAISLK